jgi:hypothetical protein
MAYEYFIPLVLAPQRQQSQLVTLMIPAMVPGLSPSARSVAMGVTAQTAVADAENRTVAAVNQAVEATTQVSGRPTRALSDADLSSRPNLAAAVQASPNLRARIDAAATEIGVRTQGLIDEEGARRSAALDEAVEALKEVVPAAKVDADRLEGFPEVARAIVARGATEDIVKAGDVDAFKTKFAAGAVILGG